MCTGLSAKSKNITSGVHTICRGGNLLRFLPENSGIEQRQLARPITSKSRVRIPLPPQTIFERSAGSGNPADNRGNCHTGVSCRPAKPPSFYENNGKKTYLDRRRIKQLRFPGIDIGHRPDALWKEPRDAVQPPPHIVRRQTEGKNNSWAIRWNASLFLKDILSLNVGKSLIQNNGFDGSGTNCGGGNLYIF